MSYAFPFVRGFVWSCWLQRLRCWAHWSSASVGSTRLILRRCGCLLALCSQWFVFFVEENGEAKWKSYIARLPHKDRKEIAGFPGLLSAIPGVSLFKWVTSKPCFLRFLFLFFSHAIHGMVLYAQAQPSKKTSRFILIPSRQHTFWQML